jgi:hypothetical protein
MDPTSARGRLWMQSVLHTQQNQANTPPPDASGRDSLTISEVDPVGTTSVSWRERAGAGGEGPPQ